MRWAIFLLLVFVLGCANQDAVDIEEDIVESELVYLEDLGVNVEVADDDYERMKGLMFREELCSECGMLFVFEDANLRNFWMKNTLIPLDMIFLDSEGTIVNIETAVPCESDPCPKYSSEFAAQYVVEVNAGYCEAHNITAGDKVDIAKFK